MKNLFFEKHFKTEVSDSIQRFEVIMSSFSSSEDIINEVLKFKVVRITASQRFMMSGR